MQPVLIVALLASAVGIVCGFWILVNAFRTSILWGLGSLFVPFVSLIYVIAYWEENKKPFLVSLLAGAAAGAAVVLGLPPETLAQLAQGRH